ncbi:MAG TPA: C4-dicarboxylate ABC transporter substrate-binding protein [Firmicutes bacterium]|nr:C4-dicarboxylate ABC transporter substrate-binding protein [Bacillota bacterium]
MRKYLVLLLILSLILAATITTAAATQLTFATGGTSGTYYPLGEAMAQVWSKHIPGINVTVQATGASAENIRLINDKKVDLAFVQNDVNHYAYKGIEIFKNERRADFKVIAALYPETVQIVVRAESNIKTVVDLKGKRVSVGAVGSGVEANARQILGNVKLSYRDLTAVFLSFAESADALKNGNIDAFFIVAGHPTTAIMDIATQHKIRILDFSDKEISNLRSDYEFYTKVFIPADTYSGLVPPATTVAVKAALVCNSDLDEALVYNLTKTLFEHLRELNHAKAKEFSLLHAKIGISTPFHTGALRFFAERNIK